VNEITPLEFEIRRRIEAAGPMPVGEYMALCLGDPKHGYYVTRNPLGARGDFITAPEISQMFGELIGLWAAAVWKRMGAPASARVIELGPGRGTLMKDALRAMQAMPGMREAIELHLVEISPVLRDQQRRTLDGVPMPIHWHDTFDEVPAGPSIIIANEFFDAIPINQAVKGADGWYERCIEIDAQGALAFTTAREPILHFDMLLPAAARAALPGSIFEWRADTAAMALGRRIARDNGAALVIDYGHTESATGETLQAVGHHAYADVLSAPGAVDLTAHVDFEAFARSVEAMGAVAYGPLPQSQFLRRLGIDTRAFKLKARASSAEAAAIDLAVTRLIGVGRHDMGLLFKAAAFAHPSLGALPAFDA
jgi:SAM-dependent MidA family methyltransferase